ncbi:lysozyme inhibitor LprI family protein [Alkalihalobacillus sp. FSL R5-0424]
MGKLQRMACGLVIVSVLTACGDSTDNQAEPTNVEPGEEDEAVESLDVEEYLTSEWPELAGDSVQVEYSRVAIGLENRMYEEGNILDNEDIADGFYAPYFQEWDELLNEVWGVLENQMPPEAFEALKESQVEWIDKKEAHFAEMPSDVAVEREKGMDYLTFETMNRTYYLIYNYLDVLE